MPPRRYSPASRRVVAGDSDSDSSADDTGTMHEQERAEKQMAQMAAIALRDLGSATRNLITTADDRTLSVLTERQINNLRAMNDPDSEQQALYQKNRTQVTAWGNFHATIDPNEIGEDEDIMGGQTHRLAVHERVKQERRLKEGEIQVETLRDHPRRRDGIVGRGHGIPRGRGGGMVGTRGRDSPNSRTDRPQDPAVDPNREYTYKSKTAGRSLKVSYNRATHISNNNGRRQVTTRMDTTPPKGKMVIAGQETPTPSKAKKPDRKRRPEQQKPSRRPARQPHVLPAWFGKLQENPPINPTLITQDMKIVAACPANKHSSLASPGIQGLATRPNNPFPAPAKRPLFSLQANNIENATGSVRDSSRKHEFPTTSRTVAISEQDVTALATSQQQLLARKDEPFPNTIPVNARAPNSPFGARSKVFMESLTSRPFNPNVYGAPPAAASTTPDQTSTIDQNAQILKVPVSELGLPQPISAGAMPISSAFTDGNPTPASLSGFSGGTSPMVHDDIGTYAGPAQDPPGGLSLLGLAIDVPRTTACTAPTGPATQNLARSTSGRVIDLMGDDGESISSPILKPGPAHPPLVIRRNGHLYHLMLPGEEEKHLAAKQEDAKSCSEISFTTAKETSPPPENETFESPSGEQPSLQDQSTSGYGYASRGNNPLIDYNVASHAPASGSVAHRLAAKGALEATRVSQQTHELNAKYPITEARSEILVSAQVPSPKPVNPFKRAKLATETITDATLPISQVGADSEMPYADSLAVPMSSGLRQGAAKTGRGFGANLFDAKSAEQLSRFTPTQSIHDRYVQSKRFEAKLESQRPTPTQSIQNKFTQSKKTDTEQELQRSTPTQSIHDKFVQSKKIDAKQESAPLPPLGDSRAKRNNSPQKDAKNWSSRWASTKPTRAGDALRSHIGRGDAHNPQLTPIFGDGRNLRYKDAQPTEPAETPARVPDKSVAPSAEYYGRLVGPFHNLTLRGGEDRVLAAQNAPAISSGVANLHTGRVSAKAHSGLTPVVDQEDISDTESEL